MSPLLSLCFYYSSLRAILQELFAKGDVPIVRHIKKQYKKKQNKKEDKHLCQSTEQFQRNIAYLH